MQSLKLAEQVDVLALCLSTWNARLRLPSVPFRSLCEAANRIDRNETAPVRFWFPGTLVRAMSCRRPRESGDCVGSVSPVDDRGPLGQCKRCLVDTLAPHESSSTSRKQEND